jgi:oligopeptide transport system substrate-binding protein
MRIGAVRIGEISVCWVLAVFLGLGCGGLQDPADLVIINGPEPESLDPAMITSQSDGRVVLALFEGLTRFNASSADPEPGIAASWHISDDGLVYTFQIRPEAAWSTSEPITAKDVLYSWRRILEPATACEYAGLLFCIRNAREYATGHLKDPEQIGLSVSGDHSFRVELVEPTAYFLDICALPNFAVVPRRAIEESGDRWLMKAPVRASGAFSLDSWRLNDRIRLRRNPHYWDAANTRSDRVDLLPCSNANTALNLYETGAVDIVWDKELAPSELVDLLVTRPDFHRFDTLGTYFIRLNVTRVPFDDVRVRQALAMAIDKKLIVEKITRGGERVADQFVPPILPGYHSPPGLAYDPEKARELLAEAGFPGGQDFPPMEYMYNNTGKNHERIAVELRAMWGRELGVSVNLRKLESKVYLRAQALREYDACRSSWIGDYSDPNTFLEVFLSDSGNNRTGWKEPRYDKLLRQANGEPDPVRREELLRSAESILIREAVPIIPLYIYSGLEYYDGTRVGGIHSNSRGEHPLRAIHRLRQ